MGTALVTGGCGFIGVISRVCWPSAATACACSTAGLADAPAGVEIRKGSILDKATLASAMEGVQLVFHLAANPNLWRPDPRTLHQVNYEGTCRVLEAASNAGVERIVYTSTESILKKSMPATARRRR